MTTLAPDKLRKIVQVIDNGESPELLRELAEATGLPMAGLMDIYRWRRWRDATMAEAAGPKQNRRAAYAEAPGSMHGPHEDWLWE